MARRRARKSAGPPRGRCLHGCGCDVFRSSRAAAHRKDGRICRCSHEERRHVLLDKEGHEVEEETKKPKREAHSRTIPLPPELARVATAFDELRDATIAAIAAQKFTEASSVDVVHRRPTSLLDPIMVPHGPPIDPHAALTPNGAKKREPAVKIAGMSRCEVALLSAIALRHPKPSSAKQVLALADYRESGGTSGAFTALRRAGYITGDFEAYRMTEDGLEILPVRPTVPKGFEERIAFWRERLDTCASAFLTIYIGRYPNAVPMAKLLEEAGYKESGGTSGAITRLRLFELIEGPRAAAGRATDYLMKGP